MSEKKISSKYLYPFLFLLVILIQFYFYKYFELYNELPISIHMWRQSDCLSFAMNYYKNGMDFFKPQVHHILGVNGYTAAEFPGMYYLVAVAYHIFGPYEWVYRLSWMVLLFTGLFCFYRTLRMYLKDEFWAICISALLFCSPVLAAYGNSFIIDPAALSFTLIAGYFYAKYMHTCKWYWLLLSILTFSYSGILKEPALITYIALLCTLIIEWLFKWKDNGKIPQIKWGKIALFFLPAVFVLAWYFFKIDYNERYYNLAFLAEIMPIWNMTSEEIAIASSKIGGTWFKEYFDETTIYITAVAFIVNLFFIRKHFMRTMFQSILMLGIAGFFLMFYWQFQNHDYYIINVILIIPITWAILVKNLRKWMIEDERTARWFKMAFSIMLLLNILYAGKRQEKRLARTYHWWIPQIEKIHHLKEAGDYLTTIGVDPSDRIISMPDATMNLTLYLLNRPGWSNLYNWNQSVENINEHIYHGAKYLVINDSSLLSADYLQPFINNKIGEYKGIYIYKLQ